MTNRISKIIAHRIAASKSNSSSKATSPKLVSSSPKPLVDPRDNASSEEESGRGRFQKNLYDCYLSSKTKEEPTSRGNLTKSPTSSLSAPVTLDNSPVPKPPALSRLSGVSTEFNTLPPLPDLDTLPSIHDGFLLGDNDKATSGTGSMLFPSALAASKKNDALVAPKHEHAKLPSDRVVRTKDGLAVLLYNSGAHPVAESSLPRKFQRWNKQEDALLMTAIEIEGSSPVNWKLISSEYFLGSRNEAQCKGRWKKALDPSVNRAPFTLHEDEIIIENRLDDMSYGEIAKMLDRRISEQVRDRYINFIDPTLNTKKHVPWSHQEKKVLFDAQKRIGNKWTSISTLIPGRSENDVKNHWHNAKMASRRAMRRLANEQNHALQRARHQHEIARTSSPCDDSGDDEQDEHYYESV
jgi:hypothetical protein